MIGTLTSAPSHSAGSFGARIVRHDPARWEQTASLVLRNAHVGALQDWWRNPPGQSWRGRLWGQVAAFFRRAPGPRRARGAFLAENSWPKELELEGFTFDRLGGLYGTGEEADMMARPSSCYVEWLRKDLGSSAQPYEHLASLFRRAGDPGKANALLFAARERQRRLALSGVDRSGRPQASRGAPRRGSVDAKADDRLRSRLPLLPRPVVGRRLVSPGHVRVDPIRHAVSGVGHGHPCSLPVSTSCCRSSRSTKLTTCSFSEILRPISHSRPGYCHSPPVYSTIFTCT